MARRAIYTLIFLAIVGAVGGAVGIVAMQGLGRYRAEAPMQVGALVTLRLVPLPGMRLDDRVLERERQVVAARAGFTDGPGQLDVMRPKVRLGTDKHGGHLLLVRIGRIERQELDGTVQTLQARGRVAIVALPHPVAASASVRGAQILASDDDLAPETIEAGVDDRGAPAIDLGFKRVAGARLASYTSAHIGEYIGLAVDGRVRVSVRVAQSFPHGDFQIGNVGTTTTIKNLAVLVKNGPLPIPLQIVSMRVTSARMQL